MPISREEIRQAARPPIGLMPKKIHKEKRFYEVCAAISRHYSAGLKIPVEWVEEYNELLNDIPRHPARHLLYMKRRAKH